MTSFNSSYVPVLFSSGTSVVGDQLVLGKDPSFWTWWRKNESVFYWPHLLLNAFTGGSQPNQRADLKIGPDTAVLGDSGGFQILTQTIRKGIKLNIDPIQILRWQERNSDCAFIIDWPCGPEESEDFFEKCVVESKANCQIYQDHMESDKVRMLKVLHGYTDERMKRWYDAIQHFDFRGNTGWSFGLHPSGDVFGQARVFAFLYSQGFRGYLHFLGVSGWNTMPIVVYASRFMDTVIYDSSSYTQGYRSMTYMMPPDLGRRGEISFGERRQSWHELTRPPCTCPVCMFLLENGISFADSMCHPQYGGHLISLHNLWLYIERSLKLRALVPDKERYFKYVHENCSKEVYVALQYIDDVMRVGYEEATREYSRWMGKETNHLATNFGKFFTSGGEKPKEKAAIRLEGTPKEKKEKRTRKSKNVSPSNGVVAFSVTVDLTPTHLLDPVIPDQDETYEKVFVDLDENGVTSPSTEIRTFGELTSKVSSMPVLPPSVEKKSTLAKKEVPYVLNLEESNPVVHLEIANQKPECFGTYEKSLCTDNAFCGEHFDNCSSGGLR